MSDLYNKFTKETQIIVKNARNIAEKYSHSYISSTHLFLGLIVQRSNLAVQIMEFMGFDMEELFEGVSTQMQPENGSTPTDEILFTPVIKTILEIAEEEAHYYRTESIEPIFILLGILRAKDSEVSEMLKSSGINYKEVKTLFEDLLKKQQSINGLFGSFFEAAEKMAGGGGDNYYTTTKTKSKKGKKSNTPALDAFGRNLTEAASKKELDPVIGRETETKRIWQMLARRKKNNVILTGASGGGKTAVIEGLANCIAAGNVPKKLANKEIIQIDISGMVAGSKYRGEFEKKLKTVIEECINEKNIILFIDELHTIIGSGNGEGAMDGANILKPYLSSGQIQMIGATTTEEYQKYFEKDSALVRRFQKLMINPPNKEDTLKILKGLKKEYEAYHNVSYNNETLELIVELSDKYITTQVEPDRSINTLDEVGSKISITEEDKLPKELLDLRKKFELLDEKQQEMVQKQNYEEAGKLKKEKEQIIPMLEEMNKKYSSSSKKEVTQQDVREVFSMISGVPVESVQSNSGDAKRYLSMAEQLGKKIINQDEALKLISNTVKRKKAGIENSNKPTVLLFAGSSGVGKSYTAKKLAEFLFHDEKKMVFLNGAEYADKTALNRLTSSNPGYVGYGEATDFEYIRNNPYSILLVDECEKMHPEIWQIFLRIFEEGELKTANGKLINFKNCIIILTSNLGSQKAQKKSVGFDLSSSGQKGDERKTKYQEAIKAYFKPEVLNRISNVVVFNDLSKEDLHNIVKLELIPLIASLKEKGINLIIKKNVEDYIIQNSDDKEGNMGARPIKRSIENLLNDKLADIVLEKGDTIKTITINVSKNQLAFTTK